MLAIGLLAAAAGVVVLERPDDAELLQRVLGQVGDLNRRIEVRARTSTASDPMVRARQLAKGDGVDAVIWIDDAGGNFAVTVVHLASGRPLAREVPPVRDRARSASATKEAVALIVRSTLQAIDTWRAKEPEPTVEAPPAVETPPPVQPAQIAEAQPLAFEAAFGWNAGADGGSFGPHGPELRLALRGSIWSVGVELATDLPERREDEIATVEVVRYRAAIAGAIDPLELGPIALGAALSIGPSIHRRSTVSTGSGAIATEPSTTIALAVGAEIRATYWIAWLVGIELAGGADALVGAPEVAYRRGDETIERSRPWPVQPYGRLGLVFRSSRPVTRSDTGGPL